MHDLNAFQRDVLFALAGLGETHGLGLKSELDAYYESEVNHGRLYPNLDKLVEKGLIEKGRVDDRTNSYTLTRRGERVVGDRLTWTKEQMNADG